MFKRPMICVALLFALGVFLSAYGIDSAVIGLVCLTVCVLTYIKTKKPLISLLAVALLLSGVFRMGLAHDYQNGVIAGYSGKRENMRLTVTDFSQDNKVTAYFKDGRKVHKVYLSVAENTELAPGDIIEGEITLRTPFKSKTGSTGTRESFAGNNIFLMASAEKVTQTGEKEGGLAGKIYSLRVYMNELGKKAFSGDDRAFFNAMVFGDKRLISDDLYSALQASGLNHIAVVSGMHLSVAIAFLTVFAQKLFGKRRRGYLFTLTGAFLLTLITGAGASVIRAFIMCCLYLLAEVLYRENDSPTSLAIAVLVMIGVNPFIVFNVGFILSVLSVAGIFLFNGKISAFLIKFMPTRAAEVVSLSISAQLAVIPAAVYYFGTLAPYSLLSNALLVPVSGIYVILGMIYVLLSPIPFISPVISFCMKFISQVMTSVCFRIKEFDFSLVEVSDTFVLFASGWVLLTVIIYFQPLNRKKRHRLALVFLLIFLWVYFQPADSGTKIYTIPYGAKTMTAIERQSGDSFLVDCPDIYDMQYLENPDTPFSTVILTSMSTGQIFLKESNIRTVIVPDKLFNEKDRVQLLENAKEKNIYVVFMDDSRKFQIGDALVEFIAVDDVENARAVKIEYDAKTLISFQGFRGTDLYEMGEKGMQFVSDYVILPFAAFDCEESLFTGKVLKSDLK